MNKDYNLNIMTKIEYNAPVMVKLYRLTLSMIDLNTYTYLLTVGVIAGA